MCRKEKSRVCGVHGHVISAYQAQNAADKVRQKLLRDAHVTHFTHIFSDGRQLQIGSRPLTIMVDLASKATRLIL